jgi:hypothetical protein
MVYKNKFFDKILCSNSFFCWDSDISHNITFRWVKIYLLHIPFWKLNRLNATLWVFRAVYKVIKYGTFWWEFSSCFPFWFPPIWELFSIIKAILLRETTTTTPNNCKNKSKLNITKLLSENNLKNGTQGGNHWNRTNWH